MIMPTVNIYGYKNVMEEFEGFLDDFKILVAKELSCNALELSPGEISVRFISVSGRMIADVEIEVAAHAFGDRIIRQDDICNIIRTFVKTHLSNLGDVRVWLMLSELGHSW